MACLKCGKETEDTQVFCPECQQVMEHYPVKPGTQVQLPRRSTLTPEKKPQRRRKPSAADTEAQLRGVIRWLTATVGILTALICLLAGLLLNSVLGEPETNVIGRNYTATDSSGN